MPESALPPPERCAHNLHRATDRPSDAPEPTDLCVTDLGAVHMLDCPLFVGRRCAWFDEAPDPHPASTDAEIAAARENLQRDFLGWRYRQRVRSLAKPRDLVARRIEVEVAPSVPEVEAPLVLRVPVAVAEGVAEGAPPALVTAEVVVAEEAPAEVPAPPPPPAPAVEMYPGQRRSEDRSGKKKRRPAALGARPGWQAPGSASGPSVGHAVEDDGQDDAPESPDSVLPAAADGGDDDAFGEGLDAAAPDTPAAPPPPRTVEELLEVLPGAALPERSDRDRGRRPGSAGSQGAARPRPDRGPGQGGRSRGRRRGPPGRDGGPGGPRPDRPWRQPRQPGAPGPASSAAGEAGGGARPPSGGPGAGRPTPAGPGGGEGRRRRRRRGGPGRPGGGPLDGSGRGPGGSPAPGPPSA